jgi:hypothetical protein
MWNQSPPSRTKFEGSSPPARIVSRKMAAMSHSLSTSPVGAISARIDSILGTPPSSASSSARMPVLPRVRSWWKLV